MNIAAFGLAIAGSLLANLESQAEGLHLPPDVAACNAVLEEVDNAVDPATELASAIRNPDIGLSEECIVELIGQLSTLCFQVEGAGDLSRCGESLVELTDANGVSSADQVGLIWNVFWRIARNHELNGRLDEAESALDLLLSRVEHAPSSEREWMRFAIQLRRAEVIGAQSRYGEARTLYAEMIRNAEEGHGRIDELVFPLLGLAQLYDRMGLSAEAANTLRRAQSEIERREGQDSGSLLLVLDRRSRLHRRLGEAVVAEAIERRIKRIELLTQETEE